MIKSMSQRFNKIAPEIYYNGQGLSNLIVSSLKYNGRARLMNRGNSIDLYSFVFKNYPKELDGLLASEIIVFLEDKYDIEVEAVFVKRGTVDPNRVISLILEYKFDEKNIRITLLNKYKEALPNDRFKDIY